MQLQWNLPFRCWPCGNSLKSKISFKNALKKVLYFARSLAQEYKFLGISPSNNLGQSKFMENNKIIRSPHIASHQLVDSR